MRPLRLRGEGLAGSDDLILHPPILPLPYLKFTDKEFRHDFGSTPP